MPLPTLPELRAHLNMSGTADDGELSDMLDAAVDVVEGIIGPIAAQTVTETHRGVRSDVLVLRRMPVIDLVSASSRYGAAVSPLDVAGLELDPDAGLLRRVDGLGFAGSFTVTYTAGLSTVPAAVRLAVLIIAAHLFETQRMPGFQSDGSLPTGFGGADGVPDITPVGTGYAIPNRAQDLLRPYMRASVIA